MTIPGSDTLKPHLLRYMLEANGPVKLSVLIQDMSKRFDLTEEERNLRIESGRRQFDTRVTTAVMHLKKAGSMETPYRAHWQLTSVGKEEARRVSQVAEEEIQAARQVGGLFGRDEGGDGHGIEGEGPFEIAQAYVEAPAAFENVLNLRIALGASEGGVEIDQRDVRHGQAHVLGQQPNDELGQQGSRALAGSPELCHKQPCILGVENGREGASLLERHHIPRGIVGRQHHEPGE